MSNSSSERNLTKLPNLASVCHRYGVSNYAGATIASATLVDYDIITKVNTNQFIGLQKLGTRADDAEKTAEIQGLEI